MPLNPKIDTTYVGRPCDCCGRPKNSSHYIRTKMPFTVTGFLPICKECLGADLAKAEYSWDWMDKFCQWTDIPFIPEKFEEIKETNLDEDILMAYSTLFFSEEYGEVGWKEYNDAYLDLKEHGDLKEVVPLIKDEERARLQEKWGYNYDDEALHYLENLYNGLLMTQNVSGALQGDQALKICKISYELDLRIREGTDFDKMLASYDKLVKTAEFTPKNTKNAGDFESMGELVRWLEKKGFKNQFYDGETRDVVDETIKNIQAWNQRLYTNESNIGDEITQRIQSLQNVAQLESYYDVNPNLDYDNYENQGYEDLIKEEEFNPGFTSGATAKEDSDGD